MNNYIGTGKNIDITKAVEEATNGLVNPSFIIVMTSYKYLAEVGKILKEKYPTAQMMGTFGTNFCNGKICEEEVNITAFFDETEVRVGVINDLSKYPAKHIASLESNLNSIGVKEDSTVCIEMCTGWEERLVSTINAVLEKFSVDLIGGTAFGNPEGTVPYILYNGEVYEDACVYAIIKNKKGKIKTFKENIYGVPDNAKEHHITKAEPEIKKVMELDGKPITQVYNEELNIPIDKITDNVFVNPIGRIVYNDVYISSMKTLVNDGLIMFKQLYKNDTIYFLELLDYDSVEKQNREKIQNSMPNVSLVFSIDCIYRYILYQNKGYINQYVKDMASISNHIGFVGGGEQYNKQHINQSMVCAVFE